MEYRRINLSISDCTSNGWDLAKKYGLLLAIIYLVIIISIITGIIGNMFTPMDFWAKYLEAVQTQDVNSLQDLANSARSPLTYVGNTLQWIVETILFAGFISIILKLRKGTMQSVSLSPYAMNVMTYIKYFGTTLLNSLIIVFGTLCCIIPGIWLAVKLQFAPMYILDHPDKDIDDAFKASWKMTNGNWWSLLGMGFVQLGIALIGLCICCIGFYFAVPFTYFIEADAYYTLLAQYEDVESETETIEEGTFETIEEPVAEPAEETIIETTAEPTAESEPESTEDSYNKDEK